MRWLACLLVTLGGTFSGEIEPRRVFFGVVKDESLRTLAPRNGVITDEAVFDKLWQAWRPIDRTPMVDFASEFVLVRTETNGKIDRFFLKVEASDLKVRLGHTDAKDYPGFSIGIAIVRRKGIKSIDGMMLRK